MGAFLRVSCSLLRKDAWLQAEIGATFVGICGMFPEHIIAVVDKCARPTPTPLPPRRLLRHPPALQHRLAARRRRDWFVISMLRMLRSPPEEEVFTGMLGMLHDIVAHPTATPESVAWLCTPAVTELCMVMVTDPFRPSCLKLVELMMTAATELGPVALRTLVQHATTHDNSRYFGETLLRTMNEAELDGESPLPVGYRPAVTVRAQPRPYAVSVAAPPFFSHRYRAVQVLGFMHATASSANFLFPADQKILLVRPCHRPSHLPPPDSTCGAMLAGRVAAPHGFHPDAGEI